MEQPLRLVPKDPRAKTGVVFGNLAKALKSRTIGDRVNANKKIDVSTTPYKGVDDRIIEQVIDAITGNERKDASPGSCLSSGV